MGCNRVGKKEPLIWGRWGARQRFRSPTERARPLRICVGLSKPLAISEPGFVQKGQEVGGHRFSPKVCWGILAAGCPVPREPPSQESEAFFCPSFRSDSVSVLWTPSRQGHKGLLPRFKGMGCTPHLLRVEVRFQKGMWDGSYRRDRLWKSQPATGRLLPKVHWLLRGELGLKP